MNAFGLHWTLLQQISNRITEGRHEQVKGIMGSHWSLGWVHDGNDSKSKEMIFSFWNVAIYMRRACMLYTKILTFSWQKDWWSSAYLRFAVVWMAKNLFSISDMEETMLVAFELKSTVIQWGAKLRIKSWFPNRLHLWIHLRRSDTGYAFRNTDSARFSCRCALYIVKSFRQEKGPNCCSNCTFRVQKCDFFDTPEGTGGRLVASPFSLNI